jgi:hypothetical protein
MIKKFENFINENIYPGERYDEKYLELFKKISMWISTNSYKKADIEFNDGRGESGLVGFSICIHLKNTESKFFIKIYDENNEVTVKRLLEAIYISIYPNEEEQVTLSLMDEDMNSYGPEEIDLIENFEELLDYLK